jgi:exopolysaccharide biosynthesis polyprenyl glycosylphosphotransferase
LPVISSPALESFPASLLPSWSIRRSSAALPAVRENVVETVGGYRMSSQHRSAATSALVPEVTPPPRARIRLEETPPSEMDWDAFLPPAAGSPRWKWARRVKRAFDIAGAGLGLVALAPLLLVIALLVRASSPGPVLYRSRYMGERGRTFVGLKFRSMVSNADELKSGMAHLNHMKGPAFKIRNDPRVTAVGRWLRKYSLDELPQLWNVLRGDMSLVGPRPPLPEEFERFSSWHRRKLAVRPGITCTWQINGRSEICDFDEWARLDLEYIEHWSLWTDLRILLRTVPAVLRGHGAY